MLTKNEITTLSLSPTKKDFVQIWNELLEVASKLSARWDPTSTNENDPGIVILKALTGIADKLNYNIDKNILEAFMPTAAQEESMRKLCEMLGYNIKYYQSAKTRVTIKYHNSEPGEEEAEAMNLGLLIPKFTVLSNSDQDINYFTINQTPVFISSTSPSLTLECMEGQLVKCESINDNYVISANQISANNRFYLPETQIAENGIFIYNIFLNSVSSDDITLSDGTVWEKVDNLNTQARGSRVFKFGFDSYESRPYVEFPEDYSELFNDGIFIYYTRTSGINGNIASHVLTQVELPTTGNWSKVSSECFTVDNVFAATTGANIETISQAYNNFKKTVGTFDTLVTCRDYMNKIYTMIDPEYGKPYVSNILVTDIRNDLNRAITICSCDDAGIFYKEKPLVEYVTAEHSIPADVNKPVFNIEDKTWHLGTLDGMKLTNKSNFIAQNSQDFKLNLPGEVSIGENDFWQITQDNKIFVTNICARQHIFTTSSNNLIDHFDIVLYPYKTYNQVKNSNKKEIASIYNRSFEYSKAKLGYIQNQLDSEKLNTIAHNFISPAKGDIVSINNYLKLNATIATNTKVSNEEGKDILDNIKMALANAFNMRELDFGEDIPFDSIVNVIEKADSRIRVASMNEPALYTTFSVLDDDTINPKIIEYAVASNWISASDAETAQNLDINNFDSTNARQIYNKLVLRNILAGRVSLFNYNTTFSTDFSETVYRESRVLSSCPEGLVQPTEDNPYTVYINGTTVYTGQYVDLDESDNSICVYTESYIPELFNNTVVDAETGNITNDTIIDSVENEPVVKITPSCTLLTSQDTGTVEDITLGANEFVKFRAPNFITLKTYPAYVNYHLKLTNAIKTEARAAKERSLFTLLDEDRTSWSTENQNIRWQRVLDYSPFKKYKKTFTLSQTITPVKALNSSEKDSNAIIDNNIASSNTTDDIATLLAKSGCIKLTNEGCKPKLTWMPEDGQVAPTNISLSGFGLDSAIVENPFIFNESTIEDIKAAVNSILIKHKDQLPNGDCSWTVSFDFECVPFEAASLSAWESFVQSVGLFKDFTPVVDNGTVLWRLYGEGYNIGRCITASSSKLLKFDKNYFGLLPEKYLTGVYLVSDLGADAISAIIKNNEEYTLKANEFLYIEYTPSSTTEDGTTQELAAVTEVHGKGTIIKPSGFEVGVVDSSIYTKSGHSTHKTVDFITANGTAQIGMHSLGANEQIEIRELAKVELTADTFKDNKGINIYKNFNNCPELESLGGKRTYTLKDEEYIFYTDRNKSEFAYFTSGTEVTLTGSVVIPQFDIVSIADILKDGAEVVPWRYISLAGFEDSIKFQEFQYITLGQSDRVVNIQLLNSNEEVTSDSWVYCKSAEYELADGTAEKLPMLSIDNRAEGSCGWEVTSLLGLSVSPDSAQTIRYVPDKINTSITLSSNLPGGGGEIAKRISLMDSTNTINDAKSVLFKLNAACQTNGSAITLDKAYSYTDNLNGFKLKFFSKKPPAIVTTKQGKVVPYSNNVDITTWTGKPLSEKSYTDFWNMVAMSDISIANPDDIMAPDNALRLCINNTSNTYGIVSFYLKYADQAQSEENEHSTWIEVMPGTSHNNIVLVNASDTENVLAWKTFTDGRADRLYLKPGINCVKFIKPCEFFIKSSYNANGTIFFDDLKLVNCEPIKYRAGNEEHIKLTKGLNLAQLNYLPVSESNFISESIKQQLCDSLFEDADNKLRELGKETEQSTDSKAKYLATILPTVEQLIIDLTNISENTSSSILIDTCNELKESISKETGLLQALSGSDVEIESKLVSLLSQFSSQEVTKPQLLEELTKIAEQIYKNISNSTDITLIDSFETFSTAYNETKEIKSAITEIELIASKKYNDEFNSKLTELIYELEQTLGTEEKDSLANIRDQLKIKINGTSKLDISYYIEELFRAINAIENSNKILVDLESISNSENTTNYTAGTTSSILKAALELEAVFATSDIRHTSEKLSEALLNSNDAELIKFAEQFKNDIKSNSFKAITDKISTLITNIRSSSTPKISTIQNNIKDIRTAINEYYYTGTPSILASISEQLSVLVEKLNYSVSDSDITEQEDAETKLLLGILDTLNKLVESINTSENTDFKAVVQRIESFIDNRITNIVEQDAQGNYKNRDYIDAAVLSVWPKYFKDFVLNVIIANFKAAIGNKDIKLDLSIIPEKFSLLLMSEQLTKLKDAIAAMYHMDTKREAILDRVHELSGVIGLKDSVISDAVSSFASTDTAITTTTLIKSLLLELNDLKSGTTTVTNTHRKLQLITLLQDELTKLIDTDTQLLTLVENALYSNIVYIRKKYATVKEPTLEDNYKKYLADVTASAILRKDTNFINYLTDIGEALTAVKQKNYTVFKEKWPVDSNDSSKLFLDYYNWAITVIANCDLQLEIKRVLAELQEKTTEISSDSVLISDILESLQKAIYDIENLYIADKEKFTVLDIENQLLNDILKIDIDRDFLYTAIPENSLAIEFGNDKVASTLMNPAMNYDLNNINNSFVISKLDINYLNTGLQIARSSKLN